MPTCADRRGLRGEARGGLNHASTLNQLRHWPLRRGHAVHRATPILWRMGTKGATTKRHRLMWSLLALVGLFSMHGLSTHGTAGPNGDPGSAISGSAMSGSTMSSSTMSSSTVSGSTASGAAMSLAPVDAHGAEPRGASDDIEPVTTPTLSSTTTASGCDCDGSTGHSDGQGHAPGQSMLMALCLALIALVVTWLVRRGAWPLPRAAARGPALLARGVPVMAPLRPPQLAMLGVWRC